MISITRTRISITMAAALLLSAGTSFAQDAAEAVEAAVTLDTGDTAWMIVATVLVVLMTLPGLALFYGGLVRSKNILSVLVQCMVVAAVMSIVWVVYGYTFAAGPGNSFFGDGSMMMLKHLSENPEGVLHGTIPESVWITFQMTFIMITPALIVGAFAERMKFSAILIFTLLWTTFSYLPVWHMAWSEGGLFYGWGVLDFAGGTVVHINAGIAGLVACIMVGKRKGYGTASMMPHNVPFTVIGACLLWVGWFGFNAGSAGAANGSAGMAMLTTQIATAAAVLSWLLIETIVTKKTTAVGAATGAVAGLVAITPACGSTGVLGALVIGTLSGFVCYFCATTMKRKLGYDDSLDVFGVHCVGGILGAVLTGVFIRDGIDAVDNQLWVQIKSVAVTAIWSGVVATIALLIAKFTVGLRVPEQEESEGIDTHTHGETGYNL